MPLSSSLISALGVSLSVLLLPMSASGVASPSSQDGAELSQVLEQADGVLAGRRNTAEWRNEAGALLERLRLAVSDDPAAPQVPAAMLRIGEILERMGSPEEALVEYERVGANPGEFGWRLEALLRCVRIASSTDDGPHRALEFLDDFEQGFVAATRQGREPWVQHLKTFDGRQVIRANIFATAAQRIGSGRQSPVDATVVGLYLVQAGDLLDGWVAARGHLEHPAALATERIRGASYYVEAAALLGRSGDAAAAESARFAASHLLEYAMLDPWSEGRQHYAAALQLKNLFAIHGVGDEYILQAGRVLGVAVPGHEALSYLRELGDSVTGNPKTLVFADDVFRLVAETEMRWFPDEYRQHVNYQWSRVEQGMIALAFGDVGKARRIADELDSLPLEGEYFAGRRDHIRKSVDGRSAPEPQAEVSPEVAEEALSPDDPDGDSADEALPSTSEERGTGDGESIVQPAASPPAPPPQSGSDHTLGRETEPHMSETSGRGAFWVGLGAVSVMIGVSMFLRLLRTRADAVAALRRSSHGHNRVTAKPPSAPRV